MDILVVVLLVIILVLTLRIYSCCCKSGGKPSFRPPSSQVTNNSGTLIHMVKIGGVEFTEHLAECAEGCSTGFIAVSEGNNNIQLQQTSGGSWVDLGNLGPFEKDASYSVNIRTDGTFCAELWKRQQTSTTFNDDTTRVMVTSNCPSS